MCQPHCDIVQSGIAFSYSARKVCSPVTSAVNANSPFPTVNGDKGSSCCKTGLCRETSAARSIDDDSAAKELDTPSIPPAAVSVFRNLRRDIILCRQKSAGTESLLQLAVPDSISTTVPPLENKLQHHLHASRVVCLCSGRNLAKVSGGRIHSYLGATEEPGMIHRIQQIEP